MACKPGFVLAGCYRRWMTIHLGAVLPQRSSNLPAWSQGGTPLVRPCSKALADAPCLFGLAPGEVCLATHVTMRAVGSYPTFSPLLVGCSARSHIAVRLLRAASRAHGWLGRSVLAGHAPPETTDKRFVSVALSLGFRRAGVTRHRFLWSPDFPRDEIRCVGGLASSAPYKLIAQSSSHLAR